MENRTLGKCCICERENETVRSIITLDLKMPDAEPRGGWGCVVCGLDARGAVAVLCDECADESALDRRKFKFACLGFPGENRRIEIEKLAEVWEHDLTKHPESWDWEKALAHFRAVRSQYQQLAGEPDANTTLALQHVFQPIAARYYDGERTWKLYQAMLNVE